MPRSYSFDYFQADHPDRAKQIHFGAKEKFSKTREHAEHPHDEGPLHYGHKFAQTRELYLAHGMRKDLEELVPEEEYAEELEERPEADEGEGPLEPPRIASTTSATQPIGSVPFTEPPVESRFREAFDDATRRARLLVDAARDFSRAGLKLAFLPWDLAKIAARRFLPGRA